MTVPWVPTLPTPSRPRSVGLPNPRKCHRVTGRSTREGRGGRRSPTRRKSSFPTGPSSTDGEPCTRVRDGRRDGVYGRGSSTTTDPVRTNVHPRRPTGREKSLRVRWVTSLTFPLFRVPILPVSCFSVPGVGGLVDPITTLVGDQWRWVVCVGLK